MRRQHGSAALKIVLALVLLGLVAALAAVYWMRHNPLEMLEWTRRKTLERAGFTEVKGEVGGGRFVYWRGGEGPKLVLLHGSGDRAGTWATVAPSLAAGYEVLIPDLPGHGDSAPAGGPLPLSLILDRTESWLVGQTVGAPAILVGNSMGAWIAVELARRQPAAVERLVLINGGPLRGEPKGLTLTPADREQARRLMEALRDPSSPEVPDYVLDAIVRRAATGPIGRMMAELPDMESHLLDDSRLGEVTVPVDLLWGESDQLLGLEYARRLLAGLPRARLTTLPACGHVPQVECPAKLYPALEALLEKPAPAGAPQPADPGAETSEAPPAATQAGSSGAQGATQGRAPGEGLG